MAERFRNGTTAVDDETFECVGEAEVRDHRGGVIVSPIWPLAHFMAMHRVNPYPLDVVGQVRREFPNGKPEHALSRRVVISERFYDA